MSAKNKKQKHHRMRPAKLNPTNQPVRHRSHPGRIIIPIVIVLGVAAIVYAVTRPKGPATTTTTTNTPPVSMANGRPPAKPPPPPGPPTGPRFAAGDNIYDFGKVAGDTPVDCLISFTNTGVEPLVLAQVESGCYCMKIGQWTREVAPGQTGTMAVRVDTSHVTGPFGKSVFVTCNDPAQIKPRIEIKGFVWRPMEITPPSAVLNLSSESPSNSASVRVISHLDVPLTLSNIQLNLPNLAVDLVTNQVGKEYQFNVRTVPPLITNTLRGQLKFNTSATNSPTGEFMVAVNYVPVLQAIPYQLRIAPPPYTNSISVMATVRNNGTNTLVISEATVNVPGVEVKAQDDPMNRGQTITINFPAGFDTPLGTNTALLVKTTHPQYPEIRVPIIPAGPALRK